MTPTLLISTVRQALDMPMLIEWKALAVARAVLEAIREPGEVALSAAQEAYCVYGQSGNLRTSPAAVGHLSAVHRAMIDALLSTLKAEAGA